MFKKLLLLVLFMGSCTENNTESKDVLRVGIPLEPVSLYPYGSNDVASARISVNIFDRLLEKDKDGNLIPSLATSWEVIDPTQLKLVLRTNAVFHNGEVLSPEDVKFSLEQAIKSPEIQHIANPIKEIEIVDGETVLIKLHAPFAPILSHLAHSAMGILNKKAAQEAGQEIDQKPVGTGPYKLKAWNRGQNVLLEAHTQYWGEPVKISNIVLSVIPEASARTIALETGDLDIAYDIDAVDRDRIQEHTELQLIEQPIARIEYFGFNIEKGSNPIWKDQRVREAVSLAIDRDGYIDSILFGAGTPASSPIYKTVIGHYSGLTPRQRNLERAKELIKEAGVAPGTKVGIWTSDGQRQKTAEIIQANLKEIGLEADINVYEWGRFLDGTSKGEHDTFLLGWTTVTGDADYGMYNLLHSKAFGGAGNRTFYSNETVDNLLDAARVELDTEKRNDLYKQVQVIFDKELPFFPLVYKLSNVGASKKVKGFVFDVNDSHRLNTVHF